MDAYNQSTNTTTDDNTECCALVRTDSTGVCSSTRGWFITPMGKERRIKRLALKIQKRRKSVYLNHFQKAFKLVKNRAMLSIAFHNTCLNYDTIKNIADKIS